MEYQFVDTPQEWLLQRSYHPYLQLIVEDKF